MRDDELKWLVGRVQDYTRARSLSLVDVGSDAWLRLIPQRPLYPDEQEAWRVANVERLFRANLGKDGH